MKIMDGLILTELAEEYVAVPMGEAAQKLHGLIRLNRTGRDVWLGICEGLSTEEIAETLLTKYSGGTREETLAAVREIVDRLIAEGIVER